MSKVAVRSAVMRPTTDDIPLNEYLRALYVDGVVDQTALDAVAADVETATATISDLSDTVAAQASDIETLQANYAALEARVGALEGKFAAAIDTTWTVTVPGGTQDATITDGLITGLGSIVP